MATTTEPLFASAADLDYSPDGSADARGKIVAHSTLIIIGGRSPDTDPRVERVPGRLFGDPSGPDPNWTTIAYVHDVLVERYLKGSGPRYSTGASALGPRGDRAGHRQHTGDPHAGQLQRTSPLLGEGGAATCCFLTEIDHAPGLWTGTAETVQVPAVRGQGEGEVTRPESGASILHRQNQSRISSIESRR